ncbi:TPA: helix-turn-helix transcriptional regulator [Pasteurella multocida]|uniref:Transcriptional regulator n=1 Tax=Mergibacter septicus TaxID=221402 RepID=A0A8E3MGF7_9PAST|nr:MULTISPECIES: helix-turn-helix transcriptional regulator [Pasteurellaceae]AWX15543.1 transcriptional regulator [Mergibacter septicus]MEB3484658.1 helix-turn-helix transcriptional regulator [Pasteurella multocida]MEB3494435.1 helix-turn-helix transcriptional regulator [Pasteurella multocida]QDJ14797.1 transcriptional regulator [Mergibacter septicus]UTU47774.1 helix-turn-helix transcriptional regulator [Mergibacter septicus]
MKNLILNEKELRKKMIDLNIKTINELAIKAGVSKPTIYEYINGKSPLSAAFVRLCDYLNVDPHEILIESETTSIED